MKFTVTKMDAARRQLRTAIELWFAKGDPVAIHTLAYAAHEIIHRLFRHKGLSDLVFDTTAVEDSQRAAFAKSIKQSANFFKHSKIEKAEDEIDFDPQMNVLFLVMSVVALEHMKEPRSDEEAALMVWHALHEPSLFPNFQKMFQERIPVDLRTELMVLKRDEFLHAFRKTLAARVCTAMGAKRSPI